MEELDCRVVCRVCFIMNEALREGCPLDVAFGNCLLCFFGEVVLTNGRFFVWNLCYPLSSSKNDFSLISVFKKSSFFCAATCVCVCGGGGGYLLNLSDQLRRKFSLHRPFEGGC